MAYIYLEELKEILPEIMRDWIDEDDGSWEWIFQEIEQKCCVGKRLKGKKWKKKLQSMVDTHSTVLSAHRNDINKLESLLKGNIDNVTQLGLTMKDWGAEIRHLRNEITAAKSMAETAKNRTEVKYNEIGIDKKPPHISYTLWSSAKHMLSVFEQRGATKEELEQLDFLFSKYILDVNMCDSQWRKEHKQELNNLAGAKDCTNCKYYCCTEIIKEPCIGCTDYDCWEAKDDE